MDLEAFELFNGDLYLLGEDSVIAFARETLLFKLNSYLLLQNKAGEVLAAKQQLEDVRTLINCNNKRSFRFSTIISDVIRDLLLTVKTKARFFEEKHSDFVTFTLFSEDEASLNELSKVLDLDESSYDVSEKHAAYFTANENSLLKDLRAACGVLGFVLAKAQDTVRVCFVGEKNSVSCFRKALALQLLYSERKKEDDPDAIMKKNRKPKVQNTFNFK